MSLTKKLIRLAYQKPELRKELLPLIKEACGCGCPGCADKEDSEDSEINLYGEELDASRKFDPLNKKTNPNYGPPYKEKPGKWQPDNKGKGKCYYITRNEDDRCYVTTKGGPGGKTKKPSGPAGKNKSPERKKYNKKYIKQRWPKGNRKKSAGKTKT